jgi:uncharacterized metal-binding protein YceD (DUF177 family)
VDKLNEYRIAHRGLKEGRHLFHYVLDERFFDCFDATRGTSGRLEATAEVVKSALLMEVKLQVQGSVNAACDRCLAEMSLPISGEMNLYVKQGIREEGNDDDYLILAPEDDYIDLSACLYEVYMLNYPMRAVHAEGECDGEMEQMLNEYLHGEGDKPVDPRWNDLKKLITN